MRLTAIAIALTLPAAALADDTSYCASTFDARLLDAKQAIAKQVVYEKEYQRVMPWYHAHCRLLTERELEQRQVDDPLAFVCDTQRGRPTELTPEFAAAHQHEQGVEVFQDHAHEADVCKAVDPVSLVLRAADPIHRLEVICFDDPSPECVRAREVIARARAKVREK